MKKVISAKDIEDMLRRGADLNALPDDAIYTPSARDMIRDSQETRRSPGIGVKPGGPAATAAATAKPVTASSPKPDLEAFYISPEIQKLKADICDIGRRLWGRAYVDGNGGNIAIRAREDIVLCTPTLISKGFMKPEDLCLVDLEGNQLVGAKKRTSEILMHLQMMKRQPRAIATVHCHPPHATAYGRSGHVRSE